MAAVIVVGGGFGGISAAVRLAKLGHDVRLFEAAAQVGGQLLPLEHEGYLFDHGYGTVTLPATIRDLFRKSGRPVERVLDMRYLDPGRRHVFDDKSVLDLPNGSRTDQTAAIDTLIGHGESWTRWLDDLDPVWEILRRNALELPYIGRAAFDRGQWATLHPRRTLRREAHARFRDKRLRAMAMDPARVAGHDPRSTPAFTAVEQLIERTFGRWEIVGGTTTLVASLARRLDERRVDVVLNTRVDDVESSNGRLEGVLVGGEKIPADLVIWAAPAAPRISPESAALPVIPPARTCLGLDERTPVYPAETLVHSDPPMLLTRSVTHQGPGQAWTIEHRGAEDPLRTLVRHGIDVRDNVVARLDVSPVDAVRERGNADGWQWTGWRTSLDRSMASTSIPGLYRAGVNAHPGPTIELIAMGTAVIAASIGKA